MIGPAVLVPSLQAAALARERAYRRNRARRDRQAEGYRLLRLYGQATGPRAWESARAYGRLLGAPDPGSWSSPARWVGCAAVLAWAENRGVALQP